MLTPIVSIIFGLILLVWSADRFVDGAAATARHFRLPSLLIGIVIVGFGTSAPEMVVAALASWQGTPSLALGNAYGSNITNIALILGLSALINPITVGSLILRKELPILSLVTLFAVFQLWDGEISRLDAGVLILVFLALMGWMVWQSLRNQADPLAQEIEAELAAQPMPLPKAIFWLCLGLLFLVGSSRMLVWGAVSIATTLGVSELIIGLTIVAVGTSLPELASSIIAARKNEHDIALGNILGSNLFNTLAVVGIAGLIAPIQIEPEVLYRDCAVMGVLTLSLFVIGYGFVQKPGRINRWEGGVLLAAFLAYTAYLISQVVLG